MNAESIVVSLEWAKKLKEAGWPQGESIFYRDRKADHVAQHVLGNDLDRWLERFIAAPTAEELLRKLPFRVKHDGEEYYLEIFRGQCTGTWCVFFRNMAVSKRGDLLGYKDDSLANAAAKIYCHLADHNLL